MLDKWANRQNILSGNKSSVSSTLCLCVISAICFTSLCFTEAGNWLERDFARQWLIEYRGKRPPPEDVVIVAMEASSSDKKLVLKRKPFKFDRRVYASLIDRLSDWDASAIVFDVSFEEPSSKYADSALAAAIARSGRTVLYQRLVRTAEGDIVVPPMSELSHASAHLAVFPLPKLPTKVESFWPYFTASAKKTPDGKKIIKRFPSLPVAALQVHLARSSSSRKHGIKKAPFGNSGPYAKFEPTALADYIDGEPDTGTPSIEPLPHKPITLRFLNFYGPARTIKTLSHHQILNAHEVASNSLKQAIAGKIVFVGYSSLETVDQQDGFPTVFSSADGLDLSGVEIAATALANIMDRSELQHATVAQLLAYFFILSLLITIALRLRSVLLTLLASATVGYIASRFALNSFLLHYTVYPIGAVLLLQMPIFLFIGFVAKELTSRKRHEEIRSGASMFLPQAAIHQIEHGTVDEGSSQHVHGTWLLTDVAGYTTIAETIGILKMTALTNDYFKILTKITREYHGEVIDLEGDSMTAHWEHDESQSGILAAKAALAIIKAVKQFNAYNPSTPFHTRIGLNCGWASSGGIGGNGTYRFGAIGDIVNTASRLEQLNKTLGTAILANRSVIPDSNELITRTMGSFLLKGKLQPVSVLEIVDLSDKAEEDAILFCIEFNETMNEFQHGNLPQAYSRLQNMHQRVPCDGPTSFYYNLMDSGSGIKGARMGDRREIIMMEK